MPVKRVEVVVEVKEMPASFPCSPVIREYSFKKTQIEKKYSKKKITGKIPILLKNTILGEKYTIFKFFNVCLTPCNGMLLAQNALRPIW